MDYLGRQELAMNLRIFKGVTKKMEYLFMPQCGLIRRGRQKISSSITTRRSRSQVKPSWEATKVSMRREYVICSFKIRADSNKDITST